MKKQQQSYIAASELSDFVFCRLSWALKYQQGRVSDEAARAEQTDGVAWHARQGKRFARPGILEKAGAVLLSLGVIVLVVIWLMGRWSG